MAQRVNVVLVDDIDGSDADETVTFGLDGAQFEIDLSSGNAQKLREALALYTGHARKVGGRRKTRTAKSSVAAPSEIRAWARDNGWDVPSRGRVSAEVKAAYAAAN